MYTSFEITIKVFTYNYEQLEKIAESNNIFLKFGFYLSLKGVQRGAVLKILEDELMVDPATEWIEAVSRFGVT